MLAKFARVLAATVALSSTVGAVGIAQAAKTHHRAHHRARTSASTGSTASGSSSASQPAGSAETELTGEPAAKAKGAALAAVPGATVTRASTEDPADPSKAAYEVHVRKSDGSEAVVLEDSAFKVLSVTAGGGGCP